MTFVGVKQRTLMSSFSGGDSSSELIRLSRLQRSYIRVSRTRMFVLVLPCLFAVFRVSVVVR
jgi:hypothetical protein